MAKSDENKGLLVLGIRSDRDIIKIGDDILIYLRKQTKSYSKVCIYAPKNIKIGRLMDQVGNIFNDLVKEI